MNLLRKSPNRNPKSSISAAFTVIEILVVITIIVILILIAVPSFSAMMYSSEEAMADGQLRSALRAARDVAIRSNGAGDGAAVFFFQPGGRTSILPCVKVGELSDGSTTNIYDLNFSRREIFAAAPGFSAVVLPKYWNVRGYVPAYAVTNDWYGLGGGSSTATTVDNPNLKRSWVFPETGFYNLEAADDGAKRSTFMVRFRAGSGELVGASTAPVLVLAVRPSSLGRPTINTDPNFPYRADRAEDPVRFIRQVLGKAGNDQNILDKRKLIGRTSGDMVLARPVMQIAIYNERKMAQAFGVPQLDRFTDSVYPGPNLDPSGAPLYSNYGPGAGSTSGYIAGNITIDKISQYIEGKENITDTHNFVVGPGNDSGGTLKHDDSNVRIFTIDRYSGALRKVEVQP